MNKPQENSLRWMGKVKRAACTFLGHSPASTGGARSSRGSASPAASELKTWVRGPSCDFQDKEKQGAGSEEVQEKRQADRPVISLCGCFTKNMDGVT